MSRSLQFLQHAVRALGRAVVSLVVWTVWLALVVLLGFQVYIATTNRLEVPAWMLRAIEQRLELYGVAAKFGSTSLDPTGSIFFADVKLALPSFHEPVITANGVFVRLDPWALLTRQVELQEIRVTGASCLAPAMLSSTGKTEELVRDLDLVLEPQTGGELRIHTLSARLSRLNVNARGTIYLPEQAPGRKPLPTPDFIASRYVAACRQLMAAVEKLESFDEPSVEIELVPSESRAAIASTILTARGLKLDRPLAVTAAGLRAKGRFPLIGDIPAMVPLELTADELRLPRGAMARGVRAAIRGSLNPARFTFEPAMAELSADSVTAEGVTLAAFAGRFSTGPLPRLHVELIARALDAPLAVTAHTDFAAKTAAIQFEGALAPGWLDLISRRVGRDVRKFVDFTTPLLVSGGTVEFGADWTFERLAAHVDAQGINAYRVTIDAGRGQVELTPKHFYASEAQARLGNNFARGSYEQQFGSRDFRFLLEGRLMPLDISGWFGPWWPNFFRTFAFPGGPPEASVDVSGRWGEGRRTTVFVFADVNSPVIRGARLDRARALLFIRPGFYDGVEVFGTLGEGLARGTFTYQLDPVTFAWKQFDFDGTSSIDLATAGALIGPISADWLSPFKFERPPALKISGRLEHDAAGEYRQNVRIAGRAESRFRFQEFPLDRTTFSTVIHDDEIAVEDVEAGFAGGVTKGHAKIWGKGAARRLSFDYQLRGASLGRAVAALEEFSARRKGAPPPAPGKFIQEKNNVLLSVAATAEGNFSDPFSYQGRGVAELKGAELGEVRMLGGLSETLRFTALRFTAANASFKIEGAKLAFPEVSITGDNSAIQAHGEYALDRKQLDFNAKVYPFQESGFILKKILDVALSPLSNVFEVKLTGTLDKPSWGLVLGPTNFFRNLTQSGHEDPPAKPDEERKPPAETAPATPPATGPEPIP